MSEPDLSAVPPDEREWWRQVDQGAPRRPPIIDAAPRWKPLTWWGVVKFILRIWAFALVNVVFTILYGVSFPTASWQELGIAASVTAFFVVWGEPIRQARKARRQGR